jgi:uncharacterized protein
LTTQNRKFTRIDSDFHSHGTRCSGWLYLPNEVKSPPVVIMAHGIAAERTFRLPAFADRFAKGGIAAFLFDYRCIGDSDGKPRNLVDPYRHVQDWEAAIDHVRALTCINRDRIALWGTSLSGGHVIVVASHDPDIRAIVCQVPYVDSIDTIRGTRLGQGVRLLIAASRDVFRMLTLRDAYCVPVVGDPAGVAFLTAPQAKTGYLSMIPEGSTWKNECPARCLFTLALYRPTTLSKRVRCAALIIMGERDLVCSPTYVEKAASKIQKVRLVKMPISHFEVYTGEWFDKAVEVEASFLNEHLVHAP